MFRIGQSQDIHRLEENGRPLVLAGLNIPYNKGPVSHSDGDVVFHAIGEALLGALALGDLGTYFPDTDEKFKNIDSAFILIECYNMVKAKGYIVQNIDVCVICEKPKLKNYLISMRDNVARILNIDISQISIKAQTNEKCGEIGKEMAIEATCALLLKKIEL